MKLDQGEKREKCNSIPLFGPSNMPLRGRSTITTICPLENVQFGIITVTITYVTCKDKLTKTKLYIYTNKWIPNVRKNEKIKLCIL